MYAVDAKIKIKIKIKIQDAGRFLSSMVMPNIAAFITWGLLSALFLPNGWMPNNTIALMIPPISNYLLPLLLGYTGGKMVAGERGAIVGAIATLGVVVGSNTPVFVGAMIIAPSSAYTIKIFDSMTDGKVKSGFEILVGNFSVGIIGMLFAILALFIAAPATEAITLQVASGMGYIIDSGLLPLISILVEPAKLLFLNNALNHGIFTPLGIEEVNNVGQSILFLLEANPGAGLGILLAYVHVGEKPQKATAGAASIVHFFGGIHEIYFPYVLMKPKLVVALICGSMSGIWILTIFNAGVVSIVSPGSAIAILMMTSKSSLVGVSLSIAVSAVVSFVISLLIIMSSKKKN
ncbi:PTS transporter subunit EIIC [Psychromonas sp. SA13A]|uniref:PTS transporter subunit EIIC n=1 Tax=Psychromonas sp. SA13A TaxID=2686346 RepID=UPI00140C331F|nr:PTS transporter subunit EIIC [Psychromonas sp. SA13A]